MLIAQGPLRVSLFGGGSDLPAFLESNEGAVLSFAIDRRVYVVGHPFTHRAGILLKYSRSEDVDAARELQHPIARVVLDRYGVTDIDIAVMSDVPAGTGMGSSSSFTVAFLAFVRHLCGIPTSPVDLAREACEIEIEVLKEPIGYQDQWASALGGVNLIRFSGGEVQVESIGLGAVDIAALESNLHLVPVGRPRSASELLARQGGGVTSGSRGEDVTRRMVGLVEQGRRLLLSDLDGLGPLLDEAWQLKREVAEGVSNAEVDDLYTRGMGAGATGGKLLGAGGSGYLAFYVPAEAHERFAVQFPKRLGFRISSQGAGVIHES
ncbi:MAG: GHMP kinase [Actinomycetales bacterium]|nr:GHMP kinase [Actinomycetales bacterium]